MMALLLDLSNIVGGLLLAAALLRRTPRVGGDIARATAAIAPFAWVVGVIALVAGGYYLIVHLTSGPHVFHFEVVGIGVGVALLWDRLTQRSTSKTLAGDATRAVSRATARARSQAGSGGEVVGVPLLLAIFGIVAIIVGLQGLFTPN